MEIIVNDFLKLCLSIFQYFSRSCFVSWRCCITFNLYRLDQNEHVYIMYLCMCYYENPKYYNCVQISKYKCESILRNIDWEFQFLKQKSTKYDPVTTDVHMLCPLIIFKDCLYLLADILNQVNGQSKYISWLPMSGSISLQQRQMSSFQ